MDRLLNTNLLFMQSGGRFVDQAEKRGLALPWQRGRRVSWFDINLDGRLDVVFAIANPPDARGIIYLQNPSGLFEPCTQALPGLGPDDSSGAVILFRGFRDNARHLQLSGAPGKLYRDNATGPCSFVEVPADKALGAQHTHDLVLADFTGDLSLDYFGPTKAGGAFIRKSNLKQITIGLPGRETMTDLEFKVEGEAMVIVRPASGPKSWIDSTQQRIFLGNSGVDPKEHQFELDGGDARFQGQANLALAATGFYLAVDPETSIWSITVKKDESIPFFLEIIGNDRIDLVGDIPITKDMDEGSSDVFYIQGEKTWQRTPGDFGLSKVKTSCVSAVAGDFDNDMDMDLFLGCADDMKSRPYLIYENRETHFVATRPSGTEEHYQTGMIDSVSTADFDNDGFLDILVTRGQAEIMAEHGGLTLFRNRGNANHWLRVALKGSESASDAFGARAFLYAGNRWQMRTASGGIRMTAQDEPTLHFGLGASEAVEDLLVEWPNGTLERFSAPSVNAAVTLREGAGTKVTAPQLLVARTLIEQNRPARFLLLDTTLTPPEGITWQIDGEPVENASGNTLVKSFDTTGSYAIEAMLTKVDGTSISVRTVMTVVRAH